jgi:hypothetical protein
VPSEHVRSMTVVSLEFPARFAPNHTTTTCPLASAATHGNTLDFPTVAPWLIRTGVVLHVVPRSDDEENKDVRIVCPGCVEITEIIRCECRENLVSAVGSSQRPGWASKDFMICESETWTAKFRIF